MIGLVKESEQEKSKPGYKKKIKWAVDEKRRKLRAENVRGRANERPDKTSTPLSNIQKKT